MDWAFGSGVRVPVTAVKKNKRDVFPNIFKNMARSDDPKEASVKSEASSQHHQSVTNGTET